MRKSLPLLALLPLLAGCGGGPGATDASDGYVAAPPAIEQRGVETVTGHELVMQMGEDWFRPTVVRAPAGEELTIRVENLGNLRHAFDVSAPGQTVDVSIPSGATATVRVRVPQSGRLLFFCKYHWTRGMAGYIEPSAGT
jgi:plastocyanin